MQLTFSLPDIIRPITYIFSMNYPELFYIAGLTLIFETNIKIMIKAG
jgi:hypothetical protein